MRSCKFSDRKNSSGITKNFFDDDDEFNKLVESVEDAIDSGKHPQLISQGSSGSYFAKNKNDETVGVFKPADEEPFADNNPKLAKWFQRNLMPCCFGRSCLLPNCGYLSEAGASLVDQKLELNVVPKTKIVNLSSQSFSYSKSDKHKPILPPKIGSLQTYVKDFRDAGYWLRRFEQELETLDVDLNQTFLVEFQKMVILDYIIRNTDRSDENWMIKYDPGTEGTALSRTISQKPLSTDEYDGCTSSTQRSCKVSVTATESPGLSVVSTRDHINMK